MVTLGGMFWVISKTGCQIGLSVAPGVDSVIES